MTPDTSGPTWLVPLAHYDPDSSCWRMSGGMFPSDSMPSLATFPPSGMTRDGALYELPTPVPPTDVPASSSSLFPTPIADDADNAYGRRTGFSPSLASDVQLLPTPVADHSRGLPQPGTDFQSLPNVAISLLPTPAVNDMGAGKTVEDWDAWTARMQERHGNGNGHGASLSIEALRLHAPECMTAEPHHAPERMALLPTPRAQNGEERNQTIWARDEVQPQNLKNALARLPGEPTSQPSGDGKQSSDDPHPTPPNPDAADDPGWLPLSWSG